MQAAQLQSVMEANPKKARVSCRKRASKGSSVAPTPEDTSAQVSLAEAAGPSSPRGSSLAEPLEKEVWEISDSEESFQPIQNEGVKHLCSVATPAR